jgi:Uma2 family endonuclease
MTATIPRLTVEDLEMFPNDGKRREIIGGELHVSSAPSPDHQEMAGHLYVVLYRAVTESGWGKVYFSPIDVRLSNDDQVQPDLVVLARGHLNMVHSGAIQGTPDLIVEILSPSNRAYDVVEKRQLYARFGVPEYWIVDPRGRSISIFRLERGSYIPVELTEGKLPSSVVPALVIEPEALFGQLDAE